MKVWDYGTILVIELEKEEKKVVNRIRQIKNSVERLFSEVEWRGGKCDDSDALHFYSNMMYHVDIIHYPVVYIEPEVPCPLCSKWFTLAAFDGHIICEHTRFVEIVRRWEND